MKSGVCFPSYARNAAFVTGQGSVADYPTTNLSDLDNIRRVFVSASAGFVGIGFVLPAAVPIDFLALIHHTAPAGATFYLQLSSGTDPNLADVYVSGEQLFWPSGVVNTNYPAVRPMLLPQAYVARSGALLIYDAPGIEIGAVEIGQFWEWPEINRSREVGFSSRSISERMSRGSSHVMKQWAPRTIAGTREVVDQSQLDTKVLDFEGDMGLSRAFVWCEDIEDPATWARQCALVTNQSLGGSVVTDHEVGQHSFSLVEHLR